eukprot:UN15410
MLQFDGSFFECERGRLQKTNIVLIVNRLVSQMKLRDAFNWLFKMLFVTAMKRSFSFRIEPML